VSEVAPDQTVKLVSAASGSEQEVGRHDRQAHDSMNAMEHFNLQGLDKLQGRVDCRNWKRRCRREQRWKWEGQGPERRNGLRVW